MFGKLYHTVAIVSTAIVLAGGALLGVMFGTGKLDGEQVEAIAAVLRQDPDEAEQPADSADSADSDVSETPEPSGRAASAEEIRQQRQDAQVRRALDDRATADLVAQQRLLEQTLQHLLMAEERFGRDKQQWEQELERRRGAARDEGFAKELSLVAGLSPAIAKDHIIRKWKESPADTVRLINALPEAKSKRILGQMKTPEELKVTHELLERLSQDDASQFEP